VDLVKADIGFGCQVQKLPIHRMKSFKKRTAEYRTPARNALTIFFSYFQLLIDKSIITLTQHSMHGRRVFDVH
jgi:hypothetical protein